MRSTRLFNRSALLIAGLVVGIGIATAGGAALASSGGVAKKHPKLHRGPRGPRGPRGFTGAAGPAGPVGPTGPTGATMVWSGSAYPSNRVPASSGEVAHLTFNSPVAGFVLVTANFATRVHNTAGVDCRVQTQIAPSASLPGVGVGNSSAPGFADQWINGNLPTQNGAGTYLGLNASATRVLPVVAGSNTVYLNGTTDCPAVFWGPITLTALFVHDNPAATLVAS
jgi:hypothetical protein